LPHIERLGAHRAWKARGLRVGNRCHFAFSRTIAAS
jgi:hypothetical protein